MKVLCEFDNSAPAFIRTGWKNVFEYCGHSFTFWDRTQPAFDVFSAIEPDLFIGCTYTLNRAVLKNIVARPNMKVALFCSAWGEIADRIDKTQYPITYVNDEEKRNIEFLKKTVNKPDYVFLHMTDRMKRKVIGGWCQLGVQTISIMNGADLFLYYKGKHKQEYECDIGICSGYWPYKARNLDKYFGPLNIYPPKFKLKIFGGGWNNLYWHGTLSLEEEKNLYASAKICPNISEPHSISYYSDLTERLFKVPSSGGFLIHDNAYGLQDIFLNDEVPIFSNYDEFVSIVEKYSKDEDARNSLKSRQKKIILKSHTYFDRVGKMLWSMNLKLDAKAVWAAKGKFLKEYI